MSLSLLVTSQLSLGSQLGRGGRQWPENEGYTQDVGMGGGKRVKVKSEDWERKTF